MFKAVSSTTDGDGDTDKDGMETAMGIEDELTGFENVCCCWRVRSSTCHFRCSVLRKIHASVVHGLFASKI